MRSLFVAALLTLTCCRAEPAHWTRARISFRGWHAEAVVAVSPQALRDQADHGWGSARAVEVTSAQRIAEIVRILDVPRLQPTSADPREDTKLVVDLFDQAGNRTAFRSGGGRLYTEDCSRGRDVDDQFRKFFEDCAPPRR